MKQTFKASYGDTVKWITALTILIFIIIAILFFIIPGNDIVIYSVPILFVSIIAFTAGYATQNYVVAEGKIIIRRMLGNKEIWINDITDVQALSGDALKHSMRIFGNGGLFGLYGNFYNKKLGAMNWYVTRTDKPVLITLKNNKKIIVSPDATEEFITSVKEKMPFVHT